MKLNSVYFVWVTINIQSLVRFINWACQMLLIVRVVSSISVFVTLINLIVVNFQQMILKGILWVFNFGKFWIKNFEKISHLNYVNVICQLLVLSVKLMRNVKHRLVSKMNKIDLQFVYTGKCINMLFHNSTGQHLIKYNNCIQNYCIISKVRHCTLNVIFYVVFFGTLTN